MRASRARTAICSAPLEWPSSPGLPTRNLSRRPSPSLTRSTSSRSSAMSSVGAATASPTPVGARYSPNASRSAWDHSPVVAPAREAGDGFEGLVDGGLVAAFAPALDRRALLGLHLGVDDEDAAVGAGGQRR